MIINVPEEQAPTVADGAREVRQQFAQMIDAMEGHLRQLRELVEEHTRSALNTALEGDGPAMLTLYNNVVAVLQSEEVGKTIDPLP